MKGKRRNVNLPVPASVTHKAPGVFSDHQRGLRGDTELQFPKCHPRVSVSHVCAEAVVLTLSMPVGR